MKDVAFIEAILLISFVIFVIGVAHICRNNEYLIFFSHIFALFLSIYLMRFTDKLRKTVAKKEKTLELLGELTQYYDDSTIVNKDIFLNDLKRIEEVIKKAP